ncbi:YxeA family protein [Paenibacillus sp. OSY-SE]|uniref:YxeA family protein n=1 Tax=Paenibacillus sp. OSY-SE TaxID=1196323 RepID=UPI00035FE127|nr:YxeA family protein [Paenibacillus sp. OSY-SE]
MKRTLRLLVVLVFFIMLLSACMVTEEIISTSKKADTDLYYVQIKGTGKLIDNYREYTLKGCDIHGTEKNITFTSSKPNGGPLKENAFLCLYIKKSKDASSPEVVSYEEVKEEQLPQIVKDKLGIR